jgi:hypothetical protein
MAAFNYTLSAFYFTLYAYDRRAVAYYCMTMQFQPQFYYGGLIMLSRIMISLSAGQNALVLMYFCTRYRC